MVKCSWVISEANFLVLDEKSKGRILVSLSPSSVRVPVLSKQIISRRPPSTTLGGEIQNILFFYSLSIAKEIPT
jgi:hypothetical protein